MATWKRVALAGESGNTNIATHDLTTTGSRVLTLNTGYHFTVNNAVNNIKLYLSQISTQIGNTADTALLTLSTTGGSLTMASGVNQFTGNTLSVIDTRNDGTLGGPKLELKRAPSDSNNGEAGDVIGQVQFLGEDDGGYDVVYGAMRSEIVDPSDTAEYGKIKFRYMENGTLQDIDFVKSGEYQATDEDQTENESKLKAIEIRGTSLEALTRRTQMVYQCGYNGVIQTNTTQNVYKDQMARVSNGVQMIDGANYTNSTGIVMPFDGYLVGGSFSCVRHSQSQSNTGFVKFYAKKYTPSGTGDWDDDLLIASAVTSSSEVHPVSESYLIDNGEVRSDAVKVLKGDMILPYFSVATSTNGSDYRIDDVIAQFIIYSESTFQVTA